MKMRSQFLPFQNALDEPHTTQFQFHTFNVWAYLFTHNDVYRIVVRIGLDTRQFFVIIFAYLPSPSFHGKILI